MKRFYLGLLLLFLGCGLFSLSSFAQNNDRKTVQLANQYYNKGEYEKASSLYKKLFEAKPTNSHYYRRYFESLLASKDFIHAERLVKSQIAKKKNDLSLEVDLGMLYLSKEQMTQAKAQFDGVLQKVTAKQVRLIANAFNKGDQFDYSIALYEKGRELGKNPKAYAIELARAYQKKGEFSKMMSNYLDYAATAPRNIQTVKSSLQRVVSVEEHMEDLQTQLYGRLQKEPAQLVYPELLVWTFIQQHDYESALIQVKALDRRLKENGGRMMNLGQLADSEGQYDTAINAYSYIIQNKADSPMYKAAKIALLRSRKAKITTTTDYSPADVDSLRANYEEVLKEFGKTPNTVATIKDLAHLLAYYDYDINMAVKLLEEVLEMPSADAHLKAESKLDLGDYYLIQGEVWEATLLYSQVDKAYKDDILGEEARFKNAQLSYYNADFDWAQAQLNVLKASTSELIANDALELSVFITDNMGLDTTTVTMEMFAKADLLIVQNKKVEALKMLDDINKRYPGHALEDDILLTRAEIKLKEKDYEQAIVYLEKILNDFPEDLLADNALFKLAEIHAEQFDDKEKAMELYQTLLIDHPGSLFMVEARKRYRQLRGDLFN